MRNDIDMLNKLYELALTRNIHLVDSKLPDGVKSGYVYNGSTELIMINDSITIEERIPEIAFCLGHAILHKDFNFNIFNNKDASIQRKLDERANKFADKLLTLMN